MKPEFWNDVIQIISTSPYLEHGGPYNYRLLIDKLNGLKNDEREKYKDNKCICTEGKSKCSNDVNCVFH